MEAHGSLIPVTVTDPIRQAFESLATATGDPLPYLVKLFDALRPKQCTNTKDVLVRWRHMLHQLEVMRFRNGLQSALLKLFAERRQLSLYTESGLLPNTGFFSELRRKLVHKLLPELVDQQELRDCIRQIFHQSGDHIWMESVPLEERIVVWRLLDPSTLGSDPLSQRLLEQMANAARVLSHRISAMGLEPELLRVLPSLKEKESPFLALHVELTGFVAWFEGTIGGGAPPNNEDERHLKVLIEQCRVVIDRAHRLATATFGTSMSLTFLLTRLEQHLKRLELLIAVLAVKVQVTLDDEGIVRWGIFLADAFQGERERDSLRRHFADLLGQVSLLVTENAARTSV